MSCNAPLPAIKPFIKWVRVSDTAIVIYDPSTSCFDSMQGDFALAWELLDGKHSITAISQTLLSNEDGGADALEQVSQNMKIFIEILKDKGYVDYVTAAAHSEDSNMRGGESK